MSGQSRSPKFRVLDTVKFLGGVWSGEMKVVPETVIDKIKAFPFPVTIKQLQEFVGFLRCWRVFMPHLAQVLRPCVVFDKEGCQMELW